VLTLGIEVVGIGERNDKQTDAKADQKHDGNGPGKSARSIGAQLRCGLNG
jgi:hypothetical protein